MYTISRRNAMRARLAGMLAMTLHDNFALTGAARGATEPVAASAQLTPFALNLFGRMSSKDAGANVFFSPLSIVEAVGMLQAGAKTETDGEIAAALGIAQEQLPGVIAQINEILLAKDRPYTVSLANAVWVDQNYRIKPEFAATLSGKYAAGGENCNFTSEPDKERQRINSWVSEKTRDKIKDLLPANSITPLTRLVLTNAIYFSAAWAKPFDAKLTKEDKFTLDSGQRMVSAQFMNAQLNAASLFQDESVQAIDLPYKGETASMLILLPRGITSAELARKLTAERLAGITAGLKPSPVALTLPKFKLETTYDLIPSLKAAGISRAFDPSQADFTGISESARSQGLHVSTAVHKAFIDVNEERTEAAGATGLAMTLTAIRVDPPVVFKADHPFLFAIRDRKTGELLFMGRVSDPS